MALLLMDRYCKKKKELLLAYFLNKLEYETLFMLISGLVINGQGYSKHYSIDISAHSRMSGDHDNITNALVINSSR